MALPPHATDATICSFECTFCRACAEGPLRGVCPNCGGNLCARPIRPQHDWAGDNHLGRYPASNKQRHTPANLDAHAALVEQLKDVAPEHR